MLVADDVHTEKSIEILVAGLKSEDEWIRLQAAIALDEIGEFARPAISALKEVLDDRHNKYVVRVANHALNELEGMNNQVR